MRPNNAPGNKSTALNEDGMREIIKRTSQRKQVNQGKGTEITMSTGMSEPDLQLGKECSKGKLLVMLAKFLLAGFQVIEELAPAYRPCDTSPCCPEVLHPAQGTTI